MRAVTFSEKETKRLLSERFVCTWYNQARREFPRRPPKDWKPASGEDPPLPDGAGGGNVKLFFCAPDGRILSYWRGVANPGSFARQARLALDLMPVWRKQRANPRSARRTLARVHQRKAALLRQEAQAVQRKLSGFAPDSPVAAELGERLCGLDLTAEAHQQSARNILRDPRRLMIYEAECG
jgi:hypothetical protein